MIRGPLGRLRRLPEERPAEPPTGYKAAHLLLSADGTRVGFTGISIGVRTVYGPLADAQCVFRPRHRPPTRLCDCGFYCLHSREEATGLTWCTAHRDGAVLEVTVLGRYVRHERGFRYSRQRVRTVRVGHCPCGRPAEALVDAGVGRPGWRVITRACAECAAQRRRALSFREFTRLAGGRTRVVCDLQVGYFDRPSDELTRIVDAKAREGTDRALAEAEEAEKLVPLLAAEMTLLQARLDRMQEQLSRLYGPGAGPGTER